MPIEPASLAWGKIRRALLIAFRPKLAEKKLEERRGQCNRCGVSCKILFRCPAYDDSDGSPKCMIYNDKPGVCGLFPLTRNDIYDRNKVNGSEKCGYFFVKEKVPVDEVTRGLLNGQRFSLRGTLNIVRYFMLGKGRPNGSNGRNLASPPDSL